MEQEVSRGAKTERPKRTIGEWMGGWAGRRADKGMDRLTESQS